MFFFTYSPVLCCASGMIEHGLADSSHYRPKSSVSEELAPVVEGVPGAEEFVSVSVTDIANATRELEGATDTQKGLTAPSSPIREDPHLLKPPQRASPDSSESDWETLDPSVLEEAQQKEEEEEAGGGAGAGSGAGLGLGIGEQDSEAFEPSLPITVQPQSSAGGQGVITQGLVSGLEEDQYGLPLAIFTKVSRGT